MRMQACERAVRGPGAASAVRHILPAIDGQHRPGHEGFLGGLEGRLRFGQRFAPQTFDGYSSEELRKSILSLLGLYWWY